MVTDTSVWRKHPSHLIRELKEQESKLVDARNSTYRCHALARPRSPSRSGNVEAKLSCSNSLLFALDGLAMNLEKGYRPAGDLIIEDADYQPAGIPSLCIEDCPTFYRDWTIPEMVMPVHDMSRSMTALIGPVTKWVGGNKRV
jgi:hypothetical protein